MKIIDLAERGLVPDWAIRTGIKNMLSTRYRLARRDPIDAQRNRVARFVRQLRNSPLAVCTGKANDQHYEVPSEFYQRVLGPRLKYSCCYWPDGCTTLEEAERNMLALTCERAQLADGMSVLDLGCGWGSLTLWMAEHFPNCQVTALSNSSRQRGFIEACCQKRGLTNVKVITADICNFESGQQFDRIIAIEMFEHLRNYQLLLSRIANWLAPDGRLFVHIFCHHTSPYLFETEGDINWMGRHFFTGGMMPSDDLLLYFQNDLTVQEHWRIGGKHYARTCDAWLKNLDENRQEILSLFETESADQHKAIAVQRWRMFFMACAELFRYHRGAEWFVSHYLFGKRSG